MTTHAIEAYGGVRFPRSSLERAASQLNSRQIAINADHDLTQPIRVRNLTAWVEDGDDGYARLKLKYDIHHEDSHYLDTHMAMSAMIHTPLDGRDKITIENPFVELRADHAWFPDAALIQAESMAISKGVPGNKIQTERVLQFSFLPDPQIFVDLVLPMVDDVAPAVMSAAILDGVKWLIQQRRTPKGGDENTPTRLTAKITTGDRSATFQLETNDHDIASQALDAIQGVYLEHDQHPVSDSESSSESDHGILLWDTSKGAWLPKQLHHPAPPAAPSEPED